MLYGGSLFIKSIFGVELPIIVLAIAFALAGVAYAVFVGLRAVAVSDAYSGVLVLSLAILVAILAANAIEWEFSGIPAERMTLIGDNDFPIRWHTRLTGMIFIRVFYWSTNQTITQRAMASPTIKEGQKEVLAAAAIRMLVVPPMIVILGILSYKLYGEIGDAAYGAIVGDVLPSWLSDAFAAAIAAAVLTSVNSILNASTALYVCDIREKYIGTNRNIPCLNALIIGIIVIIALLLVPIYASADSIINTIQQRYGLLSMPILPVFIVGLMFNNVDSRAAIGAVIFGVCLYGFFSFVWSPIHYIRLMFVTLITCILVAISISKYVMGTQPTLTFGNFDINNKKPN